MASPRPSPPPPAKLLTMEITVVSAKHLKNVNWRNGDLKPYAVVSLDPDYATRAATKVDDSGSTKPVWNERVLSLPYDDSSPPRLLTIDIYHFKLTETPKPLVGSARSLLRDLIGSASPGASTVRTLELRLPSGRPQGKVQISLAFRGIPSPHEYSYLSAPPPSGYYHSSASPPPRDYRTVSPSPPPVPPYSNHVPPQPSYNLTGSYSGPYHSSTFGYYSSVAGHYSAPPMPNPDCPYSERASGYGFPSAPVDYSSGPSFYEQKAKGGRMEMGAGLAVGGFAEMTLGEVLNRTGENVADGVETDQAAMRRYNGYHKDY